MHRIEVKEIKLMDATTIAVIEQINAKRENRKRQEMAQLYSKECKRKKILNNLFVVFFVILFTASMALPGILCTIIEVIL